MSSLPKREQTAGLLIRRGKIISTATNVPLIVRTERPTTVPNPARSYLDSLSKATRRTTYQILTSIAHLFSQGALGIDTFDWTALHQIHIVGLRMYLEWRIGLDPTKQHRPHTKISESTANQFMVAVRQVLRFAYEEELIPEIQYQRALKVPIFKYAPRTEATQYTLDSSDIRRLMTVCLQHSSNAGIRDAAIIALVCQTGLRRSEIVALDLEDYDASIGSFSIRSRKDDTYRTVYVSGGAARAIEKWRAIRLELSPTGPFFLPINKGDRIITTRTANVVPARLSNQAIYELVQKRSYQAHIDPPLSPHDLRSSCITGLLDATNGDLHIVADITGHKSLNIIRTYARRSEAAKRKAASLIDIPFDEPT